MAKMLEPILESLAKRIYPNGLRVGEVEKEKQAKVVK